MTDQPKKEQTEEQAASDSAGQTQETWEQGAATSASPNAAQEALEAEEGEEEEEEDGRDVEKGYSKGQFVAKLRRLADAIEKGKKFTIQVAGERLTIPADAEISIEHERSGDEEELEFQVKWKRS